MRVRFAAGWRDTPHPGLAYRTNRGSAYQYKAEEFAETRVAQKLVKKVNLILTSPPFPLQSPKKYGNTKGEEFIEWLVSILHDLLPLLADDGSLVIEMGNSWNSGEPTMSLVPLKSLIRIQENLGLHNCQQFICNNPARLPGPAEWVTRRRVRVKDSYTHVWWMAKTSTPKANNRNVLQPYSPAMQRLIGSGRYNAGTRPSDHRINAESFRTDNGGAIPASVLNLSNTAIQREYAEWCKNLSLRPHPARMQPRLAEFFIKFLTDEDDLVFDPFGGSNTTGYVAQTLQRRWIITEPRSDYLLGSAGRFAEA